MKRTALFFCAAMIVSLSTCESAPAVKNDAGLTWDDIWAMEQETGETYYVAPDGNDSNAGTGEKPFRTIRKGAGSAQPGDTVIVREGAYNERVEITKSGKPNAWITIKAASGDRVLVTSTGDFGGYNRVFWVKANYIRIEGFEVTTGDEFGKGISIEGSEHEPVHHVMIFNNIAHDCGGSGIGAVSADYLHIRGNTVCRNAWTSTWHESGINLWANKAFGSRPGFHNIIENNICYDNENKTVEKPNGPDDSFETDTWTDGNGIIIDWCRDKNASTLIRNNICFNNGGRGIQITVSVNVTIINNTLYMNSINSRSQEEFGNGNTDDNGNGSDNIVFLNNILYARSGKACVALWKDKTNCFYDNNLYFNGSINGIGQNGSTSPNRNSGGVHGTNNILNRNPLFVQTDLPVNETGNTDSGDYDFKLQAGSPCINAGYPKTIAKTDFYGNARANADLGAVAFR
jgi:parallel beta-helix repeat protein